ncbi:hypothetical protein Aab01nite_58870 [Paractinoplanes abujensis]|uniref:Uncharacterized protein n=1 Tax=Paractinoplanes abujensis TaxID=882441 RepID=A0A7W7D087_9ACTN|nr:hypothetical protein [Actinoplanes abujensis]MBB4696306.1 hypothetical protein [Actinoplanes abujensis]GID22297.1 hypothetical protein Aab01nite_58870 [Actinoplanes abujensis]
MTVPNIGPERFDQGDSFAVELRMGNPAALGRDVPITDDVSAATARATAISHRFGGVRYALSRPVTRSADTRPEADEGDADARN